MGKLAGQVKKEGNTKTNGPILYTLTSKTKEYLCEGTYDLFIENNDIIAFEVTEKTTKKSGKYANRPIYTIPHDCIIKFPDNDADVYKCCRIAYTSNYEAQKSYEDIDECATKLNMKMSSYLYDFSEDYPSENIIYSWWLYHRINRRLWILGLNYKQISAGKEFYRCSAAKLYDIIVKNPLHAMFLDLDESLKLCQRFNIEYSERDLRVSRIARFIYNKVEKDKFTCVKKSIVRKVYPRVKKYMEELTEDYDIIVRKGCYYFRYNFTVETETVEIIRQIMEGTSRTTIATNNNRQYSAFTNNISAIQHTENREDVVETNINDNVETKTPLDETQLKAVNKALEEPIFLIKGGPGRGKTKIITEIIKRLQLSNTPYAVSGYMGKTVARIREVTKDRQNSFTLHMLLKKREVIEIEHLIVDEISMVYTSLIYEVLKKYPSIKYLTLIGDHNQLQPTRCGFFMRQIMATKLIPTITLKKNYRSGESIIQFDDDDNIIETEVCELKRGSVSSVVASYEKLIKKGATINEVQIITPINEEVDNINIQCQVINSEGKKCVYDGRDRKFQLGDKVLHKVNNYDIEQYNGDMGLIIDIDTVKKLVIVDFGNKIEDFKVSTNKYANKMDRQTQGKKVRTTDMLDHAYCITVHASQGSEWNYVIFYLPKREKAFSIFFVNFFLLHTAASRSKFKLQIIGDIRAVQKAIKVVPNDPDDNLAETLRAEIAP